MENQQFFHNLYPQQFLFIAIPKRNRILGAYRLVLRKTSLLSNNRGKKPTDFKTFLETTVWWDFLSLSGVGCGTSIRDNGTWITAMGDGR